MQKISIVTDKPSKAAAIRQQLDGTFELTFLELNRIKEAGSSDRVLIDVDLANGSQAVELKERLQRTPQHRKLIFIIDKASHLEAMQARALGATAILHRPFHHQQLIRALLRDLGPLIDGPNDPVRTTPGVGKALDALRGIFEAACLGAPLNTAAIDAAGEAVILRMEEHGLSSWVSTVRKHHSQTYQHCLIVTGIAVAFAQHLGFRRADQLRLSFGAMLHDIGKARIPLAILEKPSALSTDEMALMAKHPEYGLDALKDTSGLKKELLDLVVHHHEYLDGSGYPHKLRGSEISDLVRILTICDIFGALVETRAYRPALRADSAYRILLDMGDKLDKDLVRAFGFAKTLRFDPTAKASSS
jgi:putative nucleotidyltransferase with HDIG domain